jgi:hypothetical protein
VEGTVMKQKPSGKTISKILIIIGLLVGLFGAYQLSTSLKIIELTDYEVTPESSLTMSIVGLPATVPQLDSEKQIQGFF